MRVPGSISRATALNSPSPTAESPTDGEVFLAYLEQVRCPQLGPGQLVPMDNLGAHRVAGVRERIEATGAELLYLPPLFARFQPHRASPVENQAASSLRQGAHAGRSRRRRSRKPPLRLPPRMLPRGSATVAMLYRNYENGLVPIIAVTRSSRQAIRNLGNNILRYRSRFSEPANMVDAVRQKGLTPKSGGSSSPNKTSQPTSVVSSSARRKRVTRVRSVSGHQSLNNQILRLHLRLSSRRRAIGLESGCRKCLRDRIERYGSAVAPRQHLNELKWLGIRAELLDCVPMNPDLLQPLVDDKFGNIPEPGKSRATGPRIHMPQRRRG